MDSFVHFSIDSPFNVNNNCWLTFNLSYFLFHRRNFFFCYNVRNENCWAIPSICNWQIQKYNERNPIWFDYLFRWIDQIWFVCLFIIHFLWYFCSSFVDWRIFLDAIEMTSNVCSNDNKIIFFFDCKIFVLRSRMTECDKYVLKY